MDYAFDFAQLKNSLSYLSPVSVVVSEIMSLCCVVLDTWKCHLLAADEITSLFCCTIHEEKKSYPWCFSCPVHYLLSHPLKECCISAFFLSLFVLYCQLDHLQLDCGFGERIDAAETPSKLAGLTLLLLSHLQLPLLLGKKCLRRHLLLGVGFQWMLWKQFIQLIDKGRPRLYSMQEAWHRSEVFFFMNLGACASLKKFIRTHACYIQKPISSEFLAVSFTTVFMF